MKKVIIGLFVFGLTVCSLAQNQNPLKLSLKEAVKRALEENHSVQIAKLKIAEQEGVVQQTHSGYLPQLSAEVSQAREKVNYSASGFSGSMSRYALRTERSGSESMRSVAV